MRIRDDLGRVLALGGPAGRVVSLVPGHTETLFSIGGGSLLAGVTSFCNRPADRPRLPVVGGVRDPDLPLIFSLRPDLVLASYEENRRADVEEIENRGIPVLVTRTRDVPSALAAITLMGKAVGLLDAALELVSRIRDGLDAAPIPHKTARVAFLAWEDPIVLPGSGTFVSDMLRRAGAYSVGEDFGPDWPRVSLEDLENSRLDAVLLPTEPYPYEEKNRLVWLSRKSISACAAGRVHIVNGDLINRPGPAILDGLEEIRKAASFGQG